MCLLSRRYPAFRDGPDGQELLLMIALPEHLETLPSSRFKLALVSEKLEMSMKTST